MRKLFYILQAVLCAIALFLPAVRAQEMEFKAELEGLPEKKRPGIFHRPAKDSPASQLEYANRLLDTGKPRKAMKQYCALVHEWHDSPEAVTAQMACAELLEERRSYFRAFDEFQYLIDNYTGRFPYEQAIEHQFRIAHYLMTAKRCKFFIFPGFSAPERSLPLFEKIVQNAPDWDRTHQAQFFIGLIHEQIRQYGPAIKAYETVQYRYPDSYSAAESSFRRAYCLYITANTRPRDEAGCRNAVSALARFLRDYPGNENADIAQKYLYKLKKRLAAMHYERAVFYDRIAKRPQAALITYSDFIKKFPSSDMAAQANKRIEALKMELENEE